MLSIGHVVVFRQLLQTFLPKNASFFLSVHPSQSSSSSNSDDSFDNFSNAFDDLDKQDKIHSTIDQGLHRWENG